MAWLTISLTGTGPEPEVSAVRAKQRYGDLGVWIKSRILRGVNKGNRRPKSRIRKGRGPGEGMEVARGRQVGPIATRRRPKVADTRASAARKREDAKAEGTPTSETRLSRRNMVASPPREDLLRDGEDPRRHKTQGITE
ncbi:hypothetical protein KQX54_021727 [Cotesia glomerata]|uniref:Uncharacterized protein n=1 Tax=Cotesia glomerata TaxID=32391 RepID=A0AAV7J941_COTGL|nr:hypothetical protein KQX54_021727 [Cotesia glomerata]